MRRDLRQTLPEPMHLLGRRVFLAAVAVPVFARTAFWERKPFPDWSPEEVNQMLTDSPWTRPLSVRFELGHPDDDPGFDYSDVRLPPLGGSGGGLGWPGGGQRGDSSGRFPGSGAGDGRGRTVSTEIYLTVRWSSALPIRQALLLDRHGDAASIPAPEMEALAQLQSDYVVEVFGIPATVVAGRGERFQQALEQSARLLSDGAPLRARSARVPAYGYYLSVTFRFPRLREVKTDGRQIEFYAAAGRLAIEKKFKRKDMVYQGRLEL